MASIPTTGFVGPLTRASLNGSATVAVNPAFVCPVGMTCTVTNPVVVANCPAGVTCTPTVTPGTITTVGVPGTLVYAIQSTYNNSSLDKSKSVNIARYKLQASASDMQVSSLSFDFDKRLWLYAGSVTITDDAGAVIATKSGLSASDFSELTVGTKYRLTVPVNYVVAKATTKYITVNVTALSATDRTTAETITLISSQARAVDGTGVTDTETDSTVGRTISWTGANNNNIVATIDSASPATKLVQISTSVETDNVVLGVFDLKSQNNDSRLRTLKVLISTNSAISTLFNDVRVKIGNGITVSADVVPGTATATLTFSNLDTVLTKDAYVPVTILAKVAKNVTGSVTTSLTANGTNIVAEDSSYNAVTVTASGAITSNSQTFTTSGVVASNLAVVSESSVVPQAGGISRIAHFKYALTAGDSAIYVSTSSPFAWSESATLATTTFNDFSVDNTSGDSAGYYYYIAPGQTKTFTADFKAVGSSANGSYDKIQIDSINYGTTTAATGGTLVSSDITNALKFTFF